MKANFLLLLVGSCIGIVLGIGAGLTINRVFKEDVRGSSFESLEHLRSELGKKDKRDHKADRSVSLRSLIEAHPSDAIIYTLKPNLEVKFQRSRVRTNSHGMRGEEISVEKPEGVFRIAVLGDSFVFGWGVEEEESFVSLIGKRLTELSGDDVRVQMLNFGVPGYSTFQEVAAYEEFGRKFKPDVVLVYVVDNDFGFPFYIRDLSDSAKLVPEVRMRSLSRKIKDPEKLAKMAHLLSLIDPNQALRRLADLCEEDGAKLIVTINPRKRWMKDRERLTVLDSEPRIQYVSMRERYIKHIRENNIEPKKLSLRGDPHPSVLGHQIYAAILAEDLLQILRQ